MKSSSLKSLQFLHSGKLNTQVIVELLAALVETGEAIKDLEN
jgi:hypothetical protein